MVMTSARTIGLLIGVFVTAMAISCLQPVGAERVVDSDDFTGPDGSSPDPQRWILVNLQYPVDYIELENNTVRTHIVNGGYTRMHSSFKYDTDQLTMLIDWMPRHLEDRTCQIRMEKADDSNQSYILSALYDTYGGVGWGLNVAIGGAVKSYHSYEASAVTDRWYRWNITIIGQKVNLTVRERGTGSVVYSLSEIDLDPLSREVLVRIGVHSFNRGNPSCNWDNYMIVDYTKSEPEPPVWSEVPVLTAVEDVPATYNLSDYLSDADTSLSDLLLSTNSPYVASIQGLTATFLFPNGVLRTTVTMNAYDGDSHATGQVPFDVKPVNDPPDHNVPVDHTASEGIPYTMDLRPHVWDVDNSKEELSLHVDDPYTLVDGLELTMNFPEGVRGHNITVQLSDGELSTPIALRFAVVRASEPPILDPPGRFIATEDQVSVLDMAPYIYDEDTPLEDLSLAVDGPNLTVEGFEVLFFHTRPAPEHTVLLLLSDGSDLVKAEMTVHVVPVNDPPVVGLVPPLEFLEGVEGTVDLASYVADEDDPTEALTLHIDHPALVGTSGLKLTMLYEEARPDHAVGFTVSDGKDGANGTFIARVTSVWSPPTIVGMGDLVRPYTIEVREGVEEWLDIEVEAERDTIVRYSVDSDWYGVWALSNGSIRILAEKGDVATYVATVSVEDRTGARDSAVLTIDVLNVNDPPGLPHIVSPANRSVVEAGTWVNFSVRVADPDAVLGQLLTVRWVSNLSGELAVRTTDEGLEFNRSDVPVGVHHITVVVSDGEYDRAGWFLLTVLEPYEPPGPDEGSSLLTSGGWYVIIVVILLVLVTAVTYNLYVRSRERRAGEG